MLVSARHAGLEIVKGSSELGSAESSKCCLASETRFLWRGVGLWRDPHGRAVRICQVPTVLTGIIRAGFDGDGDRCGVIHDALSLPGRGRPVWTAHVTSAVGFGAA